MRTKNQTECPSSVADKYNEDVWTTDFGSAFGLNELIYNKQK
jgi:hypothetical protein